MALIVIAVLLAIALDILFLWAWRQRRQMGRWPHWSALPVINRLPPLFRTSRSLFSEFGQSSQRVRTPGWRGWLPELSLLGALILIAGFAVVLRPQVAASSSTPVVVPLLAWVETLRQSAISYAWTWAALLVIGLGFLLAYVATREGRSPRLRRTAGLGLALLFGVEAQLSLVNGLIPLGIILYAAMAFTLYRWWRHYGSDRQDSWWQRPLPIKVEFAVVAVIFILSAGARFYLIGQQPYGVEGDESKWTIEIVQWMLEGKDVFSADYHYNSLPVSFYMQAPFQRLMGPGILAARTTVAFASVLAGLLFFFLIRRTVGPFVAVVAFFLLAISPADVVASRLANVESHVKIWAVLPLFFLYLAMDQRRLAWFALTGVSLALALITYDTLAPMLALILFLFAVEVFRTRKDGIIWWQGLLAMAVPVSFTLPGALDYLLGRSQYYGLGSRGWGAQPLAKLVDNSSAVLNNIFLNSRPDFLIVRPGPLLENAVAPLFVMGLVVALLRLRSRGPLMLISWCLIFTLPVPIALDSAMFRVIYPGWPAYYGLAALAVVLCASELVTPFLTRRFFLGALATGAALIIAANNLYIYLYVLEDPQDRVNRRLASELVLAEAKDGKVVYTPYQPNFGHLFEDEQSLIRLYLSSHLDTSQIDQYFKPVEKSELLHDLSTEPPEGNAAVILYHDPAGDSEDDQLLQGALTRCYHASPVMSQGPFSVDIIAASDLQDSKCAAPGITLASSSPEPGSSGIVSLRWTSDFPLADPRLACSALQAGTYLLTAADFSLGPGWTTETRFAPLEGEGPFMADGFGSTLATATVDAPPRAPYAVWVRSYRRTDDGWPGYVSTGGSRMPFADQIDTLNQWVWQRAGTAESLGDGQVSLTRPYGGDGRDYVSLFVDGVLLTQDLTFDPNQQPLWTTLPETPIPGGSPMGGDFVQVFGPGNYRCKVVASDHGRLVDSWGRPGASSETLPLSLAQP